MFHETLLRGSSRSTGHLQRWWLIVMVVTASFHAGCTDWSNPDGASFAWRQAGGERVSVGFGVAVPDPPPSFIVDGAEGWGEPILLRITSDKQQVNIFLSTHPLHEGESLPRFADKLVKTFAQNGPVSDLEQQKLEGSETAGWMLSFEQDVGTPEERNLRQRLVGLFHRAGKVFVLSLDTPVGRLTENGAFMERFIQGFRFLGNPQAEEPSLAATRETFTWYPAQGRLWNSGYRLSVPFDWGAWVPYLVEAPIDGGVILRLGAPGERRSFLIEVYVTDDSLEEFVAEHTAALRQQDTFDLVEESSIVSEDGLAGQGVRFRQSLEGGPPHRLSYLYFHRDGKVFAVSKGAPDQDEPLAHFAKGVRFGPSPAEATAGRHFMRGYAAFHQEEFDVASTHFEAALRVDPDAPEALWGRGIVAFEGKSWSVASAVLQRALASSSLPDALQESGWQRYGQASLALKSYETAILAFSELTALKPEAPLPHFFLAQAHAYLGEPQEVEAALRNCLRRARAQHERNPWSFLRVAEQDPALRTYTDQPWFQSLKAEFARNE